MDAVASLRSEEIGDGEMVLVRTINLNLSKMRVASTQEIGENGKLKA